jgi:hypothetical protein
VPRRKWRSSVVMKKNGGPQLRYLLALFLLGATCATACASWRGGTEAIPPCPKWSEEEVQDLKHMQESGKHPHVEHAIGRHVLHCEAIKRIID